MASSNPGDIVLDAFAGSGTTLTVSEELGRKWIGIDYSPLSIDTIIKRLVNGSEAMGDFVNGKNGSCKYKQINLIDVNRILKTGLDFYIEESLNLELISNQIIKNWNSKLNCLTNFV
jgi:adenine-specific DNA-methyltransferase